MTRKYERVDRGLKAELIRLVILQKKCTIQGAAAYLGINYENAKTTCRLYLNGKAGKQEKKGRIDRRKIDYRSLAEQARNTEAPTIEK